MILRISASFILVFSILFMPFGISVLLALICMIYFNVFWEAILVFFLSDLLYGVREPRFFNMIFVSFFISIVTIITVELIKKKLKFY